MINKSLLPFRGMHENCEKRVVHGNRGFSFIELMITVSILLVVVGGGIASFITFNDRQTVATANKELQTILRSAQTKARVRETPPECDPAAGLPLQGWRVTAPAGVPGPTVQLYASCGRVQQDSELDVVRGAVREYQLPSTVTITTDNGDLDVRFWSLYGGVQFVGTNNSTRTITVQGFDREWQFMIREGGEITEGDWL